MAGSVRSVNVGEPRLVTTPTRQVLTSFWKEPVAGRVPVRGVNLLGDDQADRRVHGGPDKAVYAYAAEETAVWETELGRRLPPAAFGENLTTDGLAVSDAVMGERWHVGSTVLEVCQPRLPCFKLGLRHQDPTLVRRFALASRPGAYLRIVQEGELQAGDAIEVDRSAVPDPDLTVRLVFQAMLHDPALAPRVLAFGDLPDMVRDWFA